MDDAYCCEQSVRVAAANESEYSVMVQLFSESDPNDEQSNGNIQSVRKSRRETALPAAAALNLPSQEP